MRWVWLLMIIAVVLVFAGFTLKTFGKMLEDALRQSFQEVMP